MQKVAYENFTLFLSEEIGVDIKDIHSTSRLEDDLGVTGDDGMDLINKYSTLFNVDISNFDFSKYFYPEPSLFNVPSTKVIELTVQELYDAITKGKLP